MEMASNLGEIPPYLDITDPRELLAKAVALSAKAIEVFAYIKPDCMLLSMENAESEK